MFGQYNQMEIAAFGAAASVGFAVGLASFGFVGPAGMCLVVGLVIILVDTFSRDTAGRGQAIRDFLHQSVKFEHAIVWCASLVVAGILAKAWL